MGKARLTVKARPTETEILVEQQPPHGVFVWDHAGLVINQFSLAPAALGPCTRQRVRGGVLCAPNAWKREVTRDLYEYPFIE